MSKVIICGTTGTVVTLEDCYIVDTSMLSQPDLELLISDPTDSELSKLAEKTGKNWNQC
jgi:hypothetical protein